MKFSVQPYVILCIDVAMFVVEYQADLLDSRFYNNLDFFCGPAKMPCIWGVLFSGLIFLGFTFFPK
jgi:hypothetical protein